mgnify:CR=1 FL=1
MNEENKSLSSIEVYIYLCDLQDKEIKNYASI